MGVVMGMGTGVWARTRLSAGRNCWRCVYYVVGQADGGFGSVGGPCFHPPRHSSNTPTNPTTQQVYALQMQLHALRRDSRRLKELYEEARRVTWGVPHPRTLGLMQVGR